MLLAPIKVNSVYFESELVWEGLFGFPSPLIEPLRPVEPIYRDHLIEAYKTKIADESRLFMDEFQVILYMINL